MPGGHEADLARELIESGLDPDTPCFVVSRATRPDEEVSETTIGQLPNLPRANAPSLLLVRVMSVKNREKALPIAAVRSKPEEF
jgi:uroporphyrin-III C-methyltransferase